MGVNDLSRNNRKLLLKPTTPLMEFQLDGHKQSAKVGLIIYCTSFCYPDPNINPMNIFSASFRRNDNIIIKIPETRRIISLDMN
jgi:hypothetical protein